jgi:hypothetical protein
MITDRKAVRLAFAGLLETLLVGTGKPAQKVYAYQPGDFKGAFPVVTVSSDGSEYVPLSFQGLALSCYLNVHVFVLYAVKTKTGEWTEENAEDALDDIDKILRGLAEANPKNVNWESLMFDGRSETGSVIIGGLEYRMEAHRFRFD